MRLLVLIIILALAGALNTAFAADDFGQPFANQAPSALSDVTPSQDVVNPWDVEPAAGGESNEAAQEQRAVDLPASDDALMQLKELESNHSNIIVDDLSP